MKRTLALILALMLCLCLFAACGEEKDADPGMDTVSAAVNAVCDNGNMQDIPESYMENTMKIPAESYTECVAKISKVGTCIDEYGVFKTEDTDALTTLLEEYLQYRGEIWMDEYLPEEYPKLENSEIWVVGDYVMYMILDDDVRYDAVDAFNGCFED